MSLRWRWVRRLGLAATALGIGLVGSGAVLSPAAADPPVKVGWWNAAAGGGTAAPAPDAPAGGIRLAVAPGKVLAYGAVQYSMPADASGTIELSIARMSPQPSQTPNPGALPDTNKVVACPTKDTSWKAGDDQDASGAPAFDCSVHHFVGAVSADGKTMTFLVGGSADQSPGTLSLAIVPELSTSIYEAGTDGPTDMTPPYTVDLGKPAATSLTIDGGSSPAAAPPPPPPPPAAAGSATGSGTTSPSGASAGGSGVPSISVPSSGSTGTDPGQTPVLASQSGAGTPAYAQPVAAAKGVSDNKHNIALALLVLLGLAILMTNNASVPRTPRALSGPNARRGGGGGAAAAAAPAAAMAPWLAMMGPRGLGRFAKTRTEPARPLI